MTQGIKRYAKLYKKLGYEFKDEALLTTALTHRSAAKSHNERLEFLGDAILGMIVAEKLFKVFPDIPEGKLTRMRSTLVKGETLAELAVEADMGKLLKLGPGEMKSGGHRRSSILADAMEAVFGAIYLEAGIEVTKTVIIAMLKKRIEKLDPNEHPKDSKTQLQEFLQARKIPLPNYDVTAIDGQDHEQTFKVTCSVTPLDEPVVGIGKSRRKAEQEAAKNTLKKLKNVIK